MTKNISRVIRLLLFYLVSVIVPEDSGHRHLTTFTAAAEVQAECSRVSEKVLDACVQASESQPTYPS